MGKKILLLLFSLFLVSCGGQKPTPGPTVSSPEPVWSPRPVFPKTPSPTPTVSPSPTLAPPTETPVVLAEGRIIFYRPTPRGHDALWILDGQGLRRITDGTFRVSFPILSPDGQRVAFVSNLEEPQGTIYLINTDGTGLQKVVASPPGAKWPAWSPDGTRIAFAAEIGIPQAHASQFDIFVVDLVTREVTNLTCTDGPDEVGPAWSPDGQKIAFACGMGVCVMNADGTGRKDITPLLPEGTGLYFSTPWWSPVGHWIATLLMPHGEMWLLAPDGSTFVRSGPLVSQHPKWSPDGKTVTYALAGFVYVFDLSSSKATKLVEGENPTWSPDGKKIAFEREGFLSILDLTDSVVIPLTEGELPQWYP
ncbi:MAG: hypothetical protein ACP5OO_13460 [Chloroflexia bacterium]